VERNLQNVISTEAAYGLSFSSATEKSAVSFHPAHNPQQTSFHIHQPVSLSQPEPNSLNASAVALPLQVSGVILTLSVAEGEG
jgi:hypothetical protein